MGNSSNNSSSVGQNIQQLYSFVQRYQDQRFGEINIFGSKFHRNEFVAEYTISVQHEKVQYVERSIRALQQAYLLNNESFPYLRIVNYTIKYNDLGLGDQLTKSCTIPQISIWLQYLRHDLKQFLNWRLQQNKPLLLDEIRMAILKALKANNLQRSIFLFYKQESQKVGVSLNLEDISIAIDGEMKFNPLMGRSFQELTLGSDFSINSNHKLGRDSFNRRIIQKRALNNKHQHQSKFNSNININSHNCKLNSLNLTNSLLPINPLQSSSDIEFLYQLKKFVNKLILQCCYNSKQNPEDNQYTSQAKEIRLFLEAINKSKSLKEIVKIVGNSSTKKFMVNFSKLKHQQSQTRFEKLLSELEQNSQRTNYTAQTSSPRKSNTKAYFPISPQQYGYH